MPAKVNLCLAVGATDADGYHELATVFQALSLFDDVTATTAGPGEFRLSFRGEGAAFLPIDGQNLAIRAARALAEHFDVADAGVEMQIRKRIPVAGGMAGGSADAAAVLVACNELWNCGATDEELTAIGATLGADIPFALLGGTALGSRRGDVVEPIPARGTFHWALALSHTGLSTPAVFRRFDELTPKPGPPEVGRELLEALAAGDVEGVGASLRNDLQDAALALQPTLGATLDIGRDAGALGALVSGSGPTCAFLARDQDHARDIGDALAVFSGVRAVRVAHGPVAGAHLEKPA